MSNTTTITITVLKYFLLSSSYIRTTDFSSWTHLCALNLFMLFTFCILLVYFVIGMKGKSENERNTRRARNIKWCSRYLGLYFTAHVYFLTKAFVTGKIGVHWPFMIRMYFIQYKLKIECLFLQSSFVFIFIFIKETKTTTFYIFYSINGI